MVVIFLGGSAFGEFGFGFGLELGFGFGLGYGLGTGSRILSVRGNGYDFSQTNELIFS